MANYVLFDGPGVKDFMAGLEEGSGLEWDALTCDGRPHVAKWHRLLNYILFPLRFVLGHRHIGRVVAWQQFYGITTALYNRLLPLHRSMRLTIMTFIYKPKAGLAGRLFHSYIRMGINSRNVVNIVVFSESEVALYSRLFPKAADKFKYVPLGISRLVPPADVTSGNHIFTAGMSNRDYDFLCTALAGTQYDVRIACPGVKTPAGCNNITVLNDCYDKDMLRELAACRVVVIPLKDRNISSGQLMLLQAMQFGKPVIITRTDTITAYVRDGETAIMIDNDCDQLLDALNRLYTDAELYQRMSLNAANSVLKDFSERRLGYNIAAMA
ncbi:MAG: glycosyltransferase family 4 protein [Staphylococcus sp.]|nr:glycosyltransferase family 4 protein [Staphylococcus sp.]